MVLFNVQLVPVERQKIEPLRFKFKFIQRVNDGVKIAQHKVDIELCCVASLGTSIMLWNKMQMFKIAFPIEEGESEKNIDITLCNIDDCVHVCMYVHNRQQNFSTVGDP